MLSQSQKEGTLQPAAKKDSISVVAGGTHLMLYNLHC